MTARSLYGYAIAALAAIAVVLAGAMVASIASPEQAYAAKSKKVSVYVVSSVAEKGDLVDTYKLSYNKDGFISKVKSVKEDYELERITYKNRRVASHFFPWASCQSAGFSNKYFYKNGKLFKSTGHDTGSFVSKYTLNKKGLVTKVVVEWPKGGYAIRPGTKVVVACKYDKKNRIAKCVDSWESKECNSEGEEIEHKGKAISSYKYDSKGYPKSLSVSDSEFRGGVFYKSMYNFKNTYKNGRLVKIVRGTDGSTYTDSYTIKYKKIKVDARDVDTIKKQQRNFIMFNYFIAPTWDLAPTDFIRNGYL